MTSEQIFGIKSVESAPFTYPKDNFEDTECHHKKSLSV